MAQIDKPSLHFNTKLYTGNYTDNTNITGVGFQPDFVWLKERSSNSSHLLQDAVRGANKDLFSDLNSAEESNTNRLKAFISDGFTVGQHNLSNQNGETYVSWNWKANGAGSSNSNGSITSTVSVNTTAGFSIVKWVGNGSAGATIGHGLGATPAVIIEKITSSTGDWLVYHHKNTSAPETEFLRLSQNNATQDEQTIWNDQAPTSSVFYVGTESTVNGNGNNCIAYCFTEKKGYSKFGSYTGNGDTDGNFVYTGFKPAFVIFKVTNDADNWHMHDLERTTNGGNPLNKVLYPNLNNAEGSVDIDFLSNGFKCRSSNNAFNASGKPYVYLAFAKNPIVGSNDVPAVAE